MKRITILPILTVLLLSLFNLSAQEKVQIQNTWTLFDCINYAFEHNIQLKQQELNTQSQSINLEYNKSEILPGISGNYRHSWGSGSYPNQYTFKIEDEAFSNGNMGINAGISLYNGSRNYLNIKIAELELNKSLSDLKKAKNDIALFIASQYLNILYDQEIIEITKSQLQISEEQFTRTKKLVEAGNSARGDLLEIQAQTAAEKVRLIESENKLKLNYLELSQTLDLDSAKSFSIAIPEGITIEAMELGEIKAIYAISRNIQPEILSAEITTKIADFEVKKSRSYYLPTVDLSAGVSTSYDLKAMDPFNPASKYQFNSQFWDKDYYYIGVGVNIPIFNKLHVKQSISQSKVQRENSILQLKQQELNLYKEIQQSHADASAALAKYNSNLESVKFSEESFKYTREKFELGVVNSFDFNLAKNNLTKAKSDLLQAKYQYIFAIKVLDFYMGKEITL